MTKKYRLFKACKYFSVIQLSNYRYEVDETFKFFIVWNDRGTKDYYCPEPMSWMIDAPNLDLPADVTGYIELAPNESKTVSEHIFTA